MFRKSTENCAKQKGVLKMSIFIDLEMNTTDTRLVRRKELKNEVIEIGAAAD